MMPRPSWQPTRRDLWPVGLGAAAAWLAGPGWSQARAPAGPNPPTGPLGQVPWRLGLAAYSLRDYLTGKLEPRMTLDGFVDQAAQWGFDAVELTAYYFQDTSDAALLALRRRCLRHGLDISGGAIGNNFCRRDPAQHREEIRKAKEWIARYALLGAKTLRVFAGPLERGDSEEEARRRCAEALLECCTTAGQHGILLALENHGGIVTTADQMLALVQMVEHEWFGVNLDTGNFRTADPYGDVARLAPHAVTVQVKTEIQVAGRPKETADLGRLMDILRQANYRGTVVLEYEAKEDPKTAIPTHAADLRELMRR